MLESNDAERHFCGQMSDDTYRNLHHLLNKVSGITYSITSPLTYWVAILNSTKGLYNFLNSSPVGDDQIDHEQWYGSILPIVLFVCIFPIATSNTRSYLRIATNLDENRQSLKEESKTLPLPKKCQRIIEGLSSVPYKGLASTGSLFMTLLALGTPGEASVGIAAATLLFNLIAAKMFLDQGHIKKAAVPDLEEGLLTAAENPVRSHQDPSEFLVVSDRNLHHLLNKVSGITYSLTSPLTYWVAILNSTKGVYNFLNSRPTGDDQIDHEQWYGSILPIVLFVCIFPIATSNTRSYLRIATNLDENRQSLKEESKTLTLPGKCHRIIEGLSSVPYKGLASTGSLFMTLLALGAPGKASLGIAAATLPFNLIAAKMFLDQGYIKRAVPDLEEGLLTAAENPVRSHQDQPEFLVVSDSVTTVSPSRNNSRVGRIGSRMSQREVQLSRTDVLPVRETTAFPAAEPAPPPPSSSSLSSSGL